MAIDIAVEQGVGELIINAPPVNALTNAGWREFATKMEALGRRDDVHCVVIRAEGRGFCAGVDIKELARDGDLIIEVNHGCYDTLRGDLRLPGPGDRRRRTASCSAAASASPASCDVIVASDDATFGLPEIDRGALGAAPHLLRMFPIQKVRRMLYTGEPITAAEAYRLGALEAVVPRAELLRDAARSSRAKIAGKSPKALRLAKESLNGIELVDVKKSYRFEQGFTLELYTSPDSQEARDAFVEKRDARFDREQQGTK